MKPWIKRTLIGIFGISILAGGLAACSHRSHGWGGGMSAEQSAEFRGKMVDRVARKLDLTEPQKVKLTALGDTLHAQRLALMPVGKDPRADMLALVSGAAFDKAGAQALVTAKTTAIQTGSPQVIAALADFYDSLNAEQQGKVREFMQRRGRKHRD